MPQSYAGLIYHLVFRTKNKQVKIPEAHLTDLYAYIGGIVRSDKGVLLAAGGMPHHIHLLLSIHREVAISTAVRDIKSRSSKWLHEKGYRNFEWQSGYSIFTVSASVAPKVKAYIANQKEHHRAKTFLDELKEFFEQYGIEYDSKYLKEEDE